MSQQKQNIVAVGPGQMTENTTTSRIISSSAICNYYSSAQSYSVDNIVEYSGALYRSLGNTNLNNQPDVSPTYWRKELADVHDGDVCLTVNGAYSNTQQRIAGLWRSLAGQPITVPLVDGQLTEADAITYNGASIPYAEVIYTVRRGSGHTRKRQGTLTIMNDGSGALTYSHEFNMFGSDVQVNIIPRITAGTVSLKYTSVLNGNTITFAYNVQGWI